MLVEVALIHIDHLSYQGCKDVISTDLLIRLTILLEGGTRDQILHLLERELVLFLILRWCLILDVFIELDLYFGL